MLLFYIRNNLFVVISSFSNNEERNIDFVANSFVCFYNIQYIFSLHNSTNVQHVLFWKSIAFKRFAFCFVGISLIKNVAACLIYHVNFLRINVEVRNNITFGGFAGSNDSVSIHAGVVPFHIVYFFVYQWKIMRKQFVNKVMYCYNRFDSRLSQTNRKFVAKSVIDVYFFIHQ